MKKLLFYAIITIAAMIQADAQTCTIDTTLIPAGKFSFPDTLPCVVRTVTNPIYDQTVQFKIPRTINAQDFGAPISLIFTVDSMVITGVSGLPTGMTAVYNPSSGVFYGGSAGCFRVSGTTNDPAGPYPISVQGTITVHGNPIPTFFDGDTTIDLSALSGLGANPFGALSLDVINPGDPCRPSSVGINDVKSFNAIIKVYPVPAINVLNVDINTVDRINGDVIVYDVMGRKSFIQKIDLIGTQSIAIDVTSFASGVYTLIVTDGNKKFASQFSVK